eukprot:540962-Lingulodinium_polyedra.AAC.1
MEPFLWIGRCSGPPAACINIGERVIPTKEWSSSRGGRNLMGSSAALVLVEAGGAGNCAACAAHCATAKGPAGPWSSCARTHWKVWP